MSPRVFIDGEAGTTGLQIADRLRARGDLELVSIDPDKRKDAAARSEIMNACDAVILCLPDDASREAVKLVQNPDTVIIDASSAHRVAEGWTYGYPELDKNQRDKLKSSKRISNPGCYPTGFIGLVRPLTAAGILPADYPVAISAVSGYSGGGKSMIAEFEDADSEMYTDDAYRVYALNQSHKHLPEMRAYTGLARPPVFMPSVGRFAQGMIIEVPLSLWALPGKPTRELIHGVLSEAYAGETFVDVKGLDECAAVKKVEPEALNDTNMLELFVFGADDQARLVARLDNLGKGASGAAVQNLNIALGLDETAGLKTI